MNDRHHGYSLGLLALRLKQCEARKKERKMEEVFVWVLGYGCRLVVSGKFIRILMFKMILLSANRSAVIVLKGYVLVQGKSKIIYKYPAAFILSH